MEPKVIWIGRIQDPDGARDVVRDRPDTGENWIKGPFRYVRTDATVVNGERFE